MPTKPVGWRNERRRHSLAARGVKTSNNIRPSVKRSREFFPQFWEEGKHGLRYTGSKNGGPQYMPDEVRYDDIVAVLGEPQDVRPDDNKVSIQWTGYIKGKGSYEIYDYKSSKKYDSVYGKVPKQLRGDDFHLQGDRAAIEEIVDRVMADKSYRRDKAKFDKNFDARMDEIRETSEELKQLSQQSRR